MQLKSTLTTVAASLLWGACCLGTGDLDGVPSLIERTAQPGRGITAEEQKVSEYVQGLGPEAIPYVLPLLKHRNGEVRDLASHTLRDMNGLGEEHLDALIESRLKGDGWIPPAIARIGTPRAIAFLADELKKERQMHTQLTVAFRILGEKGVPCLVDLVKTESSDAELQAVVASVFEELKDAAESAVTPLMEFISAGQGDEGALKSAVLALGEIGPTAQRSVPVLLKLAADNPESFKETVDQALFVMGSPDAVPGLLRRLDKKPDLIVFRDIASLKENGRRAGPALVRHLQDEDWDMRVGAARALGFVGYVEAAPSLIRLLQADDWRLVYVSLESLGRLHATEAIKPAAEVSEKHWYPPVRDTAAKTIKVISGEAEYKSTWHPNNFAMEFFEYEWVGLSPGPSLTHDAGRGRKATYVVQKDRLSKKELKRLTYKVEIAGYDSGEDKRAVPLRRQIPDTGTRVSGGCLVGADRGEWGGELVFIDFQGRQTILLNENVQNICRMTCGIVVVTGLSHLVSNEGILYKVSPGEKNVWRADRWKRLPGAPRDSGLLANGNLFVECIGGNVEVSPTGEIKMAQ